MLKIGLTGGIAGGKSLAGRMLAELGATVVDADHVAHAVYAPGSEGHAAVVEAFGPEVVGNDGTIDRSRLAAAVFNDEGRRQRLTSIVWPRARGLLEERILREQAQGASVFVVEAPLLIEAGWQDLVDQVWLVRAPADAVRVRLEARGLSGEQAVSRMAASTSVAAAAAAADVIIDNDGDVDHLRGLVESAWQQHVAPRL